jgi:gliding motility-associated-like protein
VLVVFSVYAQNKSNRGKEFWLGYGFNYNFFHDNPNTQELALYISTIQAATVTVTINGTAYSQTLNIPASTVDATIIIPKSGVNDARILTDGKTTRGIKISSNVDVAVYAHVYGTQVSGATMLMPVETYGYTYRSINHTQTTSGSRLPAQNTVTENGPDWYSWFNVIAPEDNTRIEIIPADTTKNGWLPGQTYTVNLNKGEIYNVFGKLVGNNNALWAASKDMTGSTIKSVPGADGKCHPIAVFSGSSGIRICKGDGGEFVHQQVFPIQAWGTRYLTYHTINNGNTDIAETNRNYYRVCVSDPSTIVKANGVILTGLQNNFYYNLTDSVGGFYFEADRPILVAQFTTNKNQCWGSAGGAVVGSLSYGDPEMFYLSPIEQGQKDILFYVSRKMNIDYAYTNIILPTAAVPSLRVDGAVLPSSQIIPHPNLPSFSVALARYIGAAATHRIQCDSNVTATVYGLGNFESYGYNAGCNINNLNVYGSVVNTFNTTGNTEDSITCLYTPVRLFVKLGVPALSIHWRLSQIPGIFPNTDSIINNPIPISIENINGRTYYVYTLQQDFTFSVVTNTIPIGYTSLVIPNCFQFEEAAFRFRIINGPKADFNVYNPLCIADSVRFTSNSTLNGFTINAYKWDFADGTTATTQNAVKKFNTAGTQNVRYRIIASNGCFGDTTKPVTIYDSPKSIFSINNNSICVKDSVLITDASTILNGTIANYKWDFGDGTPIVNKTTNTPFYHTYNTAGTFTIRLITNSNNNCNGDTAIRTVVVKPRPISNFGIDRNICVNDSIRLTDSSSLASGTILSTRWDFGDGTPIVVRTTNTPFYHQYTAAGTYTISLIATGNNSCSGDTMKRTVIVSAKPTSTVSFVGKPCVDSGFLFTASYPFSATTPLRYHWNFGNGQISNITNSNTVLHNYTSTATNVTIKHIIDLGGGCYSDTAITTIPFINANPTAAFTLNKDTLCANFPIQFNGSATTSTTWTWNFGNGVGNSTPPFTHNFTTPGSYTITARVTSSNGCSSSILTDNVAIKAIPLVNAGPDVVLQTGNTTTLNATVTPIGTYNVIWTPTIGLSNTNTLTTVAAPSVTTTYKIKVTDPIANCIAQDEVLVQLIDKLYIPNAFTPNNDGKNDTWNLLGLALYPDAVVTIFNRWGQKIIDTKNYNNKPWDGTFNGKPVPAGAYIYYIQYNNSANERVKGTLMVIR